MTKEDIFISIGFVDKSDPKSYEPFRRYFMRLHSKDTNEIMRYLAKKSVIFDPMKDKRWKK